MPFAVAGPGLLRGEPPGEAAVGVPLTAERDQGLTRDCPGVGLGQLPVMGGCDVEFVAPLLLPEKASNSQHTAGSGPCPRSPLPSLASQAAVPI